MRVLGLLLSLVFPACGSTGADGLPPPKPIDFASLERPSSPNTALAAPAGFHPAPDIETPLYAVPPERLLEAITAVAAAQPRTFPIARDADRAQAQYVVRSALWNFPDIVTVQVGPGPTLIIWSRSVYGRSDLGANRERVRAWLSALDRTLATHHD